MQHEESRFPVDGIGQDAHGETNGLQKTTVGIATVQMQGLSDIAIGEDESPFCMMTDDGPEMPTHYPRDFESFTIPA